MADQGQEKTEEPTGRRKTKARQEGQVPHSSEVDNALFLLMSVFVLRIGGTFMMNRLKLITSFGLENLNYDVTMLNVQALYIEYFKLFFITFLPFGIMSLFVAFLSAYIQFGWFFEPSLLKLHWNKLFNFGSGWKQLFSMSAIKNLWKSVVKIIMLLIISYLTFRNEILAFMSLVDRPITDAIGMCATLIIRLLMNILYVYIILAIGDYLLTKMDLNKNLKMTKSEVKDEHRQMEGDPQIKSRLRSLMFEESRKRMMANVPQADVVITNPVHIAVALKYDSEASAAPVVVAKGKRLIAEKIKEIARENDIPIVEDPPLARLIYQSTDLGQEIGMDLYGAVAEILAYVYNMKNRQMT